MGFTADAYCPPMNNSIARPSEEIRRIQEAVVGMYSEHPWPMYRNADEEMGWRLKCLGVVPEDYRDKRVLDMGCGTGEYSLWYATQGAREVVGIDLSTGSLEVANQRKEEARLKNVDFREVDILACDLPDNYFDYSFSVGVLHHTGDPFRGFRHLARVTKPGGVVMVSLYSSYSCRLLRAKQTFCRWLAGEDIDRRVEWGERLLEGRCESWTSATMGSTQSSSPMTSSGLHTPVFTPRERSFAGSTRRVSSSKEPSPRFGFVTTCTRLRNRSTASSETPLRASR